MKIPNRRLDSHTDVQRELDILFDKLATLLDPKKELKEFYLLLLQTYPNGVPTVIRVATNAYYGRGLIITTWQAHFLNEKGLLGREEHFSEGGYGSTNYSRSFSYRNLDVAGLYEFLADPQLPPPHD